MIGLTQSRAHAVPVAFLTVLVALVAWPVTREECACFAKMDVGTGVISCPQVSCGTNLGTCERWTQDAVTKHYQCKCLKDQQYNWDAACKCKTGWWYNSVSQTYTPDCNPGPTCGWNCYALTSAVIEELGLTGLQQLCDCRQSAP